MRNALERARLRQAGRLLSSTSETVGKDDLVRITPDDISSSRVFNESDGFGEAGEATTVGDDPDEEADEAD